MDIEENKIDIESQNIPIKRKKPNILITGTPGTGKTTISKLLCEMVEGLTYYNVGNLVFKIHSLLKL
jgi:Cdc6-like AAA superfamily ATPase